MEGCTSKKTYTNAFKLEVECYLEVTTVSFFFCLFFKYTSDIKIFKSGKIFFSFFTQGTLIRRGAINRNNTVSIFLSWTQLRFFDIYYKA
jgi:hypothetical protein